MRTKRKCPYVRVRARDRYLPEQIVVAERVHGKLRSGVVVHHVNEDKRDNRPDNLIILEHDLHNKLHQMLRAEKACGNPHWRKCLHCKQYDDVSNLYNNGSLYRHRECHKKYQREYNAKRKLLSI